MTTPVSPPPQRAPGRVNAFKAAPTERMNTFKDTAIQRRKEHKRKSAEDRERKALVPFRVTMATTCLQTTAFLFSVSLIVLLSFYFADLEVVLTEFIRRGFT